MSIQTRNPATGEVIKTFKPFTDSDVDAAISQAVVAQKELRDWTFDRRGKAMKKMAKILEDEAESLAETITLEMGKPYLQAIGEVKKCAWGCRYYAEHAQAHLANEYVETDASESYRAYFPLGVILGIMPWNFPFWQVFRFAVPALMAGNTTLLKHASNVPQCALAIEDIFKRSGLPSGAFTTLLIGGDKVERILRDDRVNAATLTGSEPAGASVASICGSEIKPTVLELGGSDAFIIMPSADIKTAVEIGCKARLQNNGQSCIAGKRFFIHADIYDDVKASFVKAFKALTIGDPMAAETSVGPLVNVASVRDITRQVENAVKAGATLLMGGRPIKGEGYYFEPGILENISVESAAYHEEIFGPVMLLFKVENMEEAIRMANDSPFGLGSSVWTQDKVEQQTAITRLEAGATYVNAMTGSDPRLPFGGIKKSGYGRELAEEGLRTWCNVKTIYVA